MTGKDLQKLVIEHARDLGWMVGHFPPIRALDGWRTPVAADGKGFPDLLLLRDRAIVAEIKGDKDKLRREQADWLTAFRMAGIAAHVWTSESWESGEVDRILTARTQARYPLEPPPLTGQARQAVIDHMTAPVVRAS